MAHAQWAEALAIERLHGDDAVRWVAERIGQLAISDDTEGFLRFRDIAEKLNVLAAQRISSRG